MSRKAASNSSRAKTQTMQQLQTKVESPIKLSPAEQRIFEDIISGVALTDWEPWRIRLAAVLAITTRQLEEYLRVLDAEGPSTINERGTPVAHPIINSVKGHTSSMQALTRTLGLSASQRGVSATSQAAKKQSQKEAQEAVDKIQSNSLLA